MQNSGAERAESSLKLYRGTTNNRRRGVRQKVHLPAQAIVSAQTGGKANEPGELLNLSEDGACILTSSPLSPDSHLTLSVDLLETNSFVATPAVVIWSDQRGRNGIFFDGITESSREKLKHWLETHATADNANQSQLGSPNEFGPRPVRPQPSRTESKRETPKREFVKQSPEQTRAAIAASSYRPEISIPADYSSILSTLVAIKREAEGTGKDLDKALQLLADRALSLTHATGSAIALGKDKAAAEMICRATAGSDAPGLGARLQIGSGFSGECVRTGKTLRCDDAEADPRVDREGCRTLGIRSIIASPVRRNDSVTGLVEVFSPNRNSFGPGEEKILERLSEMIAASMDRAEPKQGTAAIAVPPTTVAAGQKKVPRFEHLETPLDMEQWIQPPASPLRRLLYVVLGAGVIVGLLWLVLTGSTGKNFLNSVHPQSSPQQNSVKTQPSTVVSKAADFDSLRKLATDGDPNAQFDMGARYATGEDVKQDYSESVRWFTLAAEQGHVIAQATLGAYYWAGRGIPQDIGKAYFWSAIAQAGGDAASGYRVTVLASRMPHSQVIAGQQAVNEWLKKHEVSKNTQ